MPKPFWQLLGQGQGNQTALPSSTPSRARLPLIAHHVPVRNISDATSQEKARSSSSRTASPRFSPTFPHQRELNFTKEPSKKFSETNAAQETRSSLHSPGAEVKRNTLFQRRTPESRTGQKLRKIERFSLFPATKRRVVESVRQPGPPAAQPNCEFPPGPPTNRRVRACCSAGDWDSGR